MNKVKTMVHDGVEVKVSVNGIGVRLSCRGVIDQIIRQSGNGFWYYTGGTLSNANTMRLNTMIDEAVKHMAKASTERQRAKEEVNDWFDMYGVDAEE